MRRAEGPSGRKGRLPYPPEVREKLGLKGPGGPRITVRMEPEVFEWVQQVAGKRQSAWVHKLLKRLHQLHDTAKFRKCWEQLTDGLADAQQE